MLTSVQRIDVPIKFRNHLMVDCMQDQAQYRRKQYYLSLNMENSY